MNELISMMTPATLPIQALQGAPRLANGPVVLVHARGETSASREWAAALATALKTELLELDFTQVVAEVGAAAALDRTQRLAEALRPLSPRLVVLPAVVGWPAECAGRLATACGVACLVARPHHQRRGVLAATSLEDGRYPVLKEAAVVAGALGSPLTFVHNTAVRVVGASRGRRSAGMERRLDQVATELGADVVVTRALDPVSGVLGEARREDADLIVVGASTSPANGGPVGARIAGMATRSVLIVPLAA